jgi:hypothetical protein
VDRLETEIGCGRVAVCESPDLTAPAIIGCCRPLVVLPLGWRTWSKLELTAVLAHELAHVRRRDYLGWLVARFCLALHFYHPLIHWLARRLRLQQELAADALGARHAGGRSSYLRALSQMALRQENRAANRLAASFLPAPGTLMRRIQMLRARDGVQARPTSRVGRIGIMVLLAGVALSVSALRSPAQKTEEAATAANDKNEPPGESTERFYAGGFRALRGFAFRGAGQEMTAEAKRDRFDLSYLRADAKGVWAARPAIVFGRPEMKKYLAFFDLQMAETLKELQINSKPDFSIADIDQMAGVALVQTDPQQKEHPSSLMYSMTMFRTVKEFDWKKQMDKFLPGGVEVPFEGKKYYRVEKPNPILRGLLASSRSTDPRFYYCIPDSRTVVCDGDTALQRILKKEKSAVAAPVWAEDWKHVEHGVLAVAYDTRDKKWLEDRRRVVKEPDAPEDLLFENSDSIVFGVDYADGFIFQAFVRSPTEQAAEKAAKAIQALIERDRQIEVQQRSSTKKEKTIADRFLADLQEHTRMEQQGKTVKWRSEVKISLADVMAAIPQDIRKEIEAAGK